jgi:large subunit ribosomal protein L30
MKSTKQAAQLKITLVKSGIEATVSQRATLSSLGIMKPRQSVVKNNTPSIAGMVFKVKHLVKVEEL